MQRDFESAAAPTHAKMCMDTHRRKKGKKIRTQTCMDVMLRIKLIPVTLGDVCRMLTRVGAVSELRNLGQG